MPPRPLRKPNGPRPVLERLTITRGLLAALIALATLSIHTREPEPRPSVTEVLPPVEPAEPLQEYTADAGVPLRIIPAFKAGLPTTVDPRQKKPPCDPDLEGEFDGLCWTALKKPPPCPAGKAWERDGTCYTRALRAAGVPSSGEPRPVSIADP